MITTDCTKVKSGYFAIKKCFPAYINCDRGVLKTKTCPVSDGMVFDDRVKGCVRMDTCKAPLEGKFRGVHFPTLPWDDEFETRALRARLPEFVPFSVTTDCRRKTFSGHAYEVGKCHQNYLVCNKGVPIIETCPDAHVFSLRARACIKKEECEETWDQWNEKLVRHALDISVIVQTKEPTVEGCVGKKDGGYAMKPCQAEYTRCVMGTGYEMKCSEGFVFSRRFFECVGEEFCEE
ncbi:unnamed protein product [Caenorhabditis brenneri]